MKTRSDFVSNSSSCSFVICNPYAIADKDDGSLIGLLSNSAYLHIIDIDYGNKLSAFKKLKDKAAKLFGSKVKIDFEHQDSDESPPTGVYAEVNDGFYKFPTKAKRDFLLSLISKAGSLYVSFGEDIEDNLMNATQIATLLDYLYGAEIDSEDHFYYTPVKDLGIVRK